MNSYSTSIHAKWTYPQWWIGHPFSAPSIHNQCETDIRSVDDDHAEIQSFFVVLWVTHLTHNRQERTGSRGGIENSACSHHTGRKARAITGIETEFKIPCLWRGCGTVSLGDADDNDEDGSVDGDEPDVSHPANIMELAQWRWDSNDNGGNQVPPYRADGMMR